MRREHTYKGGLTVFGVWRVGKFVISSACGLHPQYDDCICILTSGQSSNLDQCNIIDDSRANTLLHDMD